MYPNNDMSRYAMYGTDDWGNAIFNPRMSTIKQPNIYDTIAGFASPTNVVGDQVVDAGVEAAINKLKYTKPTATVGKKFKYTKPTAEHISKPKAWFKNHWSAGSGVKAFGKNIGKYANIGSGIMQGAEAIGNLDKLDTARDTTDDLINRIITSSASNPLANSYLTADQRSLLGKVKRGDISSATDGSFMPDDISDIGDIAPDALLGLALGGIPGLLIGGVGSVVNSGLENATQDQIQQQAELEALLMALEDAEAQYQSMKRPNFTGLGIQQRYQDMYR